MGLPVIDSCRWLGLSPFHVWQRPVQLFELHAGGTGVSNEQFIMLELVAGHCKLGACDTQQRQEHKAPALQV